MEQNNLADKILGEIKDKHLHPKPKWEFIVKDSVVWVLVIVSLGIGSLATSVVIYMIDNNEWDLSKKINGNIVTFVFVTLPIFWLVILAIFVLFIYYNFKHTKGGYKYRAYGVIIASVSFSLISGVLLYNLGLAQAIDDVFEAKAPLYTSLVNRKQQLFHHPELGVLPAQVVQVLSPTELLVIDPRQNQWQVLIGELEGDCPCQEGRKIIAVGEMMDTGVFKALQIRELRPEPPKPQRIQQYFQLRIWQPQPR